jgi:hypothetical protein
MTTKPLAPWALVPRVKCVLFLFDDAMVLHTPSDWGGFMKELASLVHPALGGAVGASAGDALKGLGLAVGASEKGSVAEMIAQQPQDLTADKLRQQLKIGPTSARERVLDTADVASVRLTTALLPPTQYGSVDVRCRFTRKKVPRYINHALGFQKSHVTSNPTAAVATLNATFPGKVRDKRFSSDK